MAAASATSKLLRKVFHPTRHLWLETVAQTPSHRWLKIGLTERGIEDIGDVTSVQSTVLSQQDRQNDKDFQVKRGQELLQIHFEGHAITAADELYHTSWETFSDQLNVVSPISGTLLSAMDDDDDNDGSILTNEAHDDEIIDEDTVLARLKVKEGDFQRQCMEHNLVHEPQYIRLVQKSGPGKFSD
ncbi:MAG: hypothetical protein SGILL_000025 [Bacillariaceae sp.]